MYFEQIFEEKLAQYSYLIGCQRSGVAIIVDPMRDIDRYKQHAKKEGLRIVAAAETHIHADFLTGLREFAEEGVTIYASEEGGTDWKYEWLYASDYDYHLVNDGDTFEIGNIHFTVRHTPGHTPEHISYLVTDGATADEPMGILTGDFVFVGDVGRPDLLETAAGQEGAMQSSAQEMYKSVQKFKSMPEYLQVWPGHGAGSACGKALGSIPESTVGYELRFNPSIRASDTEQHFVDYILEGQSEPPLYFERMKRDNRGGPALIDGWPEPQKKEVSEIADLATTKNAVVIDTRNRSEFMSAHLQNSLLVPLNKQFPTVAGSYVRENEAIYLIVDQDNLDEAVQDLVRIGLENIKGFVTPQEIEMYLRENGRTDSIETIDFQDTAQLFTNKQFAVLDVRKESEFQEGHIRGALNIAHTRLLDREDELDRQKTWLVHCKSGGRASVAAALLKRDGFNVKYVDDHIDRWAEKETV